MWSYAKAAVEEWHVPVGSPLIHQARKALTEPRASLTGDEVRCRRVLRSPAAPAPVDRRQRWLDGSVVVNKVSELPAGHGLNVNTLELW